LAVCQGTRWAHGRGINVVTTSGGPAELILDVQRRRAYRSNPCPRRALKRSSATSGASPATATRSTPGPGALPCDHAAALHLLSENPATDAVFVSAAPANSVDNQALGRAGREEDYARLFTVAAGKSAKPHYF